MLSDRQCEILTAYVDGELEARERQVADRLLESSPEARAFLSRLEADSKELHNLPSRKAPETLADAVMGTVWETPQPHRHKPVHTPPPAPIASPKPFPRWLGITIAILVLLAVGSITFFLAGLLFSDEPATKKQPETQPPTNSFLHDLHFSSAAKFAEDVPDADIGIHFQVAQLDDEQVKNRIAMELKKDPGFWFDVPCGSNKRAIERWVEALNDTGVTVVQDPSVKASLAKKQLKVRYYLYAENLSYDDVGKLFQIVCIGEQKAPAGRNLNSVVMSRITPDKRFQIARALRVSPKEIDPTIKKLGSPAGIDTAKLDSAKAPIVPEPQRLAVIFALSFDGKAPESEQLQQFMDSRTGFAKGCVQIVVDIHEQFGWPNAAFGGPGRFGPVGMGPVAKGKGPPPSFYAKGKGKGGFSQPLKKGGGI